MALVNLIGQGDCEERASRASRNCWSCSWLAGSKWIVKGVLSWHLSYCCSKCFIKTKKLFAVFHPEINIIFLRIKFSTCRLQSWFVRCVLDVTKTRNGE